ncbi:class I SAM-dependent methyltransferase [Candidatus Woesearchaeota archaeon]|nr:class I SAM-dependent methyltransferase [Candidatus Woesearchaeota archaeon]
MKKYYERYWEKPDKAAPVTDVTTPKRLKLLFETIGEGKKVLDVGCGNGYITKKMVDQGNEVIGMDISANAIKEARRINPDIKFICCSAEQRYPFKNEKFDIVFAGEVIEHIYDTSFMFSEINRVLKNKGLLILTVPYHGILKNLYIALLNFENHYDPEGAHIRFYTVKSLKKTLSKYGFCIVTAKGILRVYPLYANMFVVAKKRRNVK